MEEETEGDGGGESVDTERVSGDERSSVHDGAGGQQEQRRRVHQTGEWVCSVSVGVQCESVCGCVCVCVCVCAV